MIQLRKGLSVYGSTQLSGTKNIIS